jgi:hypothetical protein
MKSSGRKLFRVAFCLAATLALLSPPTTSADTICETYEHRYPAYYDDCGCWACGGWSQQNCTECVDTASGAACWTRQANCLPILQYQ